MKFDFNNISGNGPGILIEMALSFFSPTEEVMMLSHL
jgi:hypothetical protein